MSYVLNKTKDVYSKWVYHLHSKIEQWHSVDLLSLMIQWYCYFHSSSNQYQEVGVQTSQIHLSFITEMAETSFKYWNTFQHSCFTLTFPPISGKTCIFPLKLSFTDDTIKHVPHRITWRLVHRFTGNCILPFRTLYIPESWIRSELPVLWGFPKMNTSKHVTC